MNIRYANNNDLGFLYYGLEDNRRIEKRPKKDIPIKISDKRLFKKGIKEKTVRILEKDKKPVGFLHFITNFKLMHVYGKFFWIDLIYIKKNHRNKGLGKLLYKDAINIAKKKGFKTIFIDIFKQNKISRNFHKKMGFKPMYSIYRKKI